MDYKKEISSVFKDDVSLLKYRLNSSKNIFIFSSFLFFLNYFLIWAKFFDSFLIKTLPFMYIAFLVSILTYTYFLSLAILPKKWIIKIILLVIFVLLFLVFLLPLI